jgi:hypothetical protein
VFPARQLDSMYKSRTCAPPFARMAIASAL